MNDRLPTWITLESSDSSPRRVSGFDSALNHPTSSSPSSSSSFSPRRQNVHKRSQTATVAPLHKSRKEKNHLVELCRQRLWFEALHWCHLHPEDARPRICLPQDASKNPFSVRARKRLEPCPRTLLVDNDDQREIYHETPLGIVCASDMMDEVDTSQLDLAKALVEVFPEQVRCSQFLPGHTPLRDAVRNCSCTMEVVELLVKADKRLKDDATGSGGSGSSSVPAIGQKDRDGLYPIDHLIKGVHLGLPNSSISAIPKLIDDSDITRHSLLVRLFSLGNYFSLLPVSSALAPSHSATIDHPRIQRIIDCTQSLLEAQPDLVHQYSSTSGCSPLHVALRNYGCCIDLIRALMEQDADGSVLCHSNHYGDLPLHVACAAGVPMDVLRLVLVRTLSASDSVTCEPHSLVWSTNNSGYTPVDLEWIRHIEAGHGFFSRRSFLPLDERGIRKASGRYDELYETLLQQAADEAATTLPVTDTFGLLLHRIFLIIRATFGDSFTCSPCDLSNVTRGILHQAAGLSGPSGPLLSHPILELILSQHQEQLEQPDHLGRLPLHHAVQARKSPSVASEKSTKEWKSWVRKLLEQAPQACAASDELGRLPLHCALDCTTNRKYPESLQETRAEVVKDLAVACPKSVEARDPVTQLYPFMQAAASRAVPLETVYWLLRRSPDLLVAPS